MGLLGKLVLKMSADSADFESNMKKARKSTKSFGDQAQQTAVIGAKAMAATGVAAAAAGAIIVKANLASIDSLAKTADKLGITTEALAGYRHATELTGVSQASADKSMQKMVRSIGEAQNGIGTARLEFDKMGLSVDALARMKPEEAFAAIAEATNDLSTNTEKAASASAIFGREGVALLNTMKLGKEGLAATSAEAKALGLSLSRVDAAKVEAANDAMTRMTAASAGFGKTLTIAVSPYIEEMAKQITAASLASGGFKNETKAAMNTAIDGAILLGQTLTGINVLIKAGVYNFLSFQESIWGALKASRELNISVREALPEFLGGKGSEGYADATRILQEQEVIMAQIAVDKAAALESGAAALTQYEQLAEKALAYRDAVEVAAQANAEIVAASAIDNAAPDAGGPTESIVTEAEAAKYAAKLAALDSYLATEAEQLNMAAAARAEMVTNAFSAGLITEERRNTLLEQVAADHQARLTALAAEGMSEREQFLAKSGGEQVKQLTGDLVSMTAATAKENKAMFEINKVASMANAVVNTAQGATLALKTYPGPMGVAMAAAVVAAGMVQIATIASTSFGGGTSPSVAATGASDVVQTVDPLESQQSTQQGVTVVIEGNVIGEQDHVDNVLIPAINDAISRAITIDQVA